ncbi:hypothetical protein SOVF_146310 [Spinacia oleracea]|nr:hypothetical protein SOVF_146310 [Spinacia oleracea]
MEKMINQTPVTYTSLREVIPPNYRRKSSKEEIHQIKNPLVKQAALAYLSPMSDLNPKPENDGNWLNKLMFKRKGSNKDKVGCIDFLNVVVFGGARFGGVQKEI